MKQDIKLRDVIGHKKGLLRKENRQIFQVMEAVVDCVAEAFGSNCEVVLHSFEDLGQAIIKIANNHVSGRKVGHPLTDFGIEVLRKANSLGRDVVDSYFNRLDDGTPIKSAAMLVRDKVGDPIGMLCINIDLSFPLFDFARELVPKDSESIVQAVEHFPSNLTDLISQMLETVTARVSGDKESFPSSRNKAIVVELYKKGMFDVRGAIDIVARKMGISRYTVYNYIRDARVDIEEEA